MLGQYKNYIYVVDLNKQATDVHAWKRRLVDFGLDPSEFAVTQYTKGKAVVKFGKADSDRAIDVIANLNSTRDWS